MSPTAAASRPGRAGLRIQGRLLIAFVGLALFLSAALTILMERTARRGLEGELGGRLEAIAAAAGMQIDPSLIAPLFSIGSEGGDRTRSRLRARLVRLRDATEVRRIYLLDGEGRVRLDTDPETVAGSELAQARAHRAMLEKVAQGRTASSPLFRDPEGRTRKTGYAPLAVGETRLGFVGVEADARFLEEIGTLRGRMVGVGAAGFLAAALLGVGLARGLTRPLARLVDAARALGRGDLDRPIPVGRADEVGFLARTLDEARVRLAERDRSLRAMVAGIAHEVRNPLGGIQIYAELLESDPKLTQAQGERIRKILGEIRRLGEIVEEFLSYARPQVPEKTAVDPAGPVQETVDLLSGLIESRKVRVEVLPPGSEIRVCVDAGQLRQVLLNLVRNALEAVAPGGAIRIAWEAQGPTAAILVEDDGPGIPLERRERIFEPFYTTKPDGAGLGLSIVRHLVEQNGGRISLERADVGGSRFTIRFEAEKGGAVG